ncbi:MAG: IS66 family transposase [Enterobacteriaceae bacterium]
MKTKVGFGIIITMKTAADLPENPDSLREITLELMRKLVQAEQQLSQTEQQLIQVDQLNRELEEALKLARQARFGRKSEVFNTLQLSLLNEDCQADVGAVETQLEKLLPEPAETKAKPRREALPVQLPREEVRCDVADKACPDCGTELRFVRDEINERLDYLPARFIVRKTVRPQYSCPCCQTMHSAPLPPQVIEKGIAAPGLLTQIVINKVIDHLPLDRQRKIFEREGIHLPTSTLSDYMGRIGAQLQPLAERLHTLLLQQPVLHADETPLTLLNARQGKVVKGYLWSYARQALNTFRGTLVVDDYAGYKALFTTGSVTEAACLAHVRRKFFKQYQANKNPVAGQALDIIRELYKLERLIKHRPPDKRRQWRQRYARPRLDAFRQWLLHQQQHCAPNSGLHKAIAHALKRWPALLTYLDDGRVPIDNNHIENCIRPVALGRKNWLFAGSLPAGKRMASIMSLLHTARLNGINPFTWLHYVLTHLPSWKNSQLDELLPLPGNTFTD